MRIIYGVQGTGHGHVVRSRAIVSELKARGHEVHCILSARRKASFPGMEVFEPCTVFRGFTGHADGGKVHLTRSIAQLRIPSFFKDARSFDASSFDLAISDFEPVTGWIARFNEQLPSVGLGHLYAYCHPVPLPLSSLPARMLLRYFVPVYTPVDTFLGLNWHHFGQPVLPPTIPEDVRPDREPRENKVLVYLPGESLEAVRAFLAPNGGHEFYVYGREHADEGHLHLRPYDREGFLADLFEASGVVANAGFSLASEALHLGKKVLLRPIRNQPEQYLNARILVKLGLGRVMHSLDPEVLRSWLEAPAPPPMNYPNVVRAFADWIDEGNWNRPEALVRRVWSEVTWPN